MKLRLKNNSVRMRLTQSEVKRFAETGRVEETIEFGTGAGQIFVYALETAVEAVSVSARLENNRITVFVPRDTADEWAKTEKIGIEAEQQIGDGKTLRLVIEKDFACLESRAGEDETDNFPHPAEGKVC